MNLQTLNHKVYYIFLTMSFIPWLVFLISVICWIVARQTNNIQRRKKATFYASFSLIFIYLIRFIPIISFASLYNKENFQSISVEKVSDVFSLLQLLVVAFVPSFSLIQSYLFKYQTLFTDGKKRSSASNEKIYLIWGTVVTVAGLIILEVFKRKFGY